MSFQVLEAKLLENDIPVFIVSFATQEMLLFRNAKTAEIVVGAEDKVEQCTYVAVVTRLPEELDNELTGGWKIVEVCSSPDAASVLLTFAHRWDEEVHALTFRQEKYIVTVHYRLPYWHYRWTALLAASIITTHFLLAGNCCDAP